RNSTVCWPSRSQWWDGTAAGQGWRTAMETDQPPSSLGPPPSNQPQVTTQTHSRRLRILLAEDNSADIFVIRDVLEQQGFDYELVTATDGEQAIRQFEAADQDTEIAPFDLALIDLNLPKYTGHEVLARLRQTIRSRGIPALIVTSSQSRSDVARAEELGATGYFRKPASLDEYAALGEIMKRVLRERPTEE